MFYRLQIRINGVDHTFQVGDAFDGIRIASINPAPYGTFKLRDAEGNVISHLVGEYVIASVEPWGRDY